MRHFQSLIRLQCLVAGVFLAILLPGCGGSPSAEESAKLDASDAVQQQIFNVRDKRDVRGLFTYLDYDDPNYRYAATMALASMPDSAALEKLAPRLQDANPFVREAAAFALGQSRMRAATPLLLKAFQAVKGDSATQFHILLLEAIGKCGDRRQLFQLATVPNFTHDKTALLLGQARGIYQFALRDSILAEGTLRMMELAVSPDISAEVRFVAATYLALNRPINLERDEYVGALLDATQSEADAKIRMFLVPALAKTKTLKARTFLTAFFEKEPDYRVRANLVGALKNFEYDSVKFVAVQALGDPVLNVQMAAADFFYEKGTDKDVELYRQYAESSGNWRVRARLYAAAVRKVSPYRVQTRVMLSKTVSLRFEGSNNLPEKSALLGALSEHGYNYDFICKMLFPKDSLAPRPEPMILSAGLSALGKIVLDEGFNATFGAYANGVRQEIANAFVQGVRTGDVGAITVISEILDKEEGSLKPYFQDLNFLVEARGKLSLPRDIEAYNALQKAIDQLNGVPPSAPKKNLPAANEVVDWPGLGALPPNATVFVETNKGMFAFQIYPNEAPATVANFARLVKSGFYKGILFHRVENNFVVQTGCPRGDGYSGIDQGLRTEISTLRYEDEGWVGMASAGPDTEGGQWFITHRPAPHLDGKYTIFGKVDQGMDVVHKLEVGDKILSVEIR